MKLRNASLGPWCICISDAAIFLICLLLAKKAENLSAKSANEAIEFGSNVENQYLAALVRV